MISRGAPKSMVNSRSITAATVPASLKTGTMMETSARGTSVNRSEFYVNGGSSSPSLPSSVRSVNPDRSIVIAV